MRKRRESRIRTIVLLTSLSMFLVISGLIESKHFRPVRPDSVSPRHHDALKKINAMPLYFERNLGQSDPSVRYLSHSSRSSLFLTDDAAVITMVGGPAPRGRLASLKKAAPSGDKSVESAVRIRLVGANAHPQFEALEPLPGRVNYLIGSDPSKYRRNVPIFGRVKMKDVYPGVDLVYYGTPQALEYDLIARNWIPILRGRPVFSTRPTSAAMDSSQPRSTSEMLASAMRQPESLSMRTAYTSRV